MDQAETFITLAAMFTHVPDAVQHFDNAMTRATITDIMGRAPIDQAWTPTYDMWIAAAEVAELLYIHGALSPQQSSLAQFESEGSKFVFGNAPATDWRMVAATLRARSPLLNDWGGVAMMDAGSPAEPFHPRSEWQQW